jgi:hypothetical protein
MFNIEKNVPLTEPRGRNAKYPFRQMDVGDSFNAPLTNGHNISQLRSALYQCGTAALGKGAVATRIAEDKRSVRVWRLK